MKTMLLRPGIFFFLLFWAVLFNAPPSGAQAFNFRSIERDSLRTAIQIKQHGFNDTIIVSHDAWDNMVSNSTTWGTNLKFKSVHDFVRFSVDYGYAPQKVMQPYTLRLTYKIYGFSNPAAPTAVTASFTDTLTVSYKPDSLATFQDRQYKKYSGFHKIMVVLTGLYKIDGAGGVPVAIDMSPSSSFDWLNFNVEAAIVAQPYNKKVLYNGSYKEAYGPNGLLDIAKLTAVNDNLPVYWQMAGTTLNPANTLPLNPVKYELEWTFVDDYKVDPSNGAVSAAAATNLQYSFTDNATRVVLDTNYYKIPLIYQRGYVIYRVRMVRPDSFNYEYPIYGNWTIAANTGTVSSVADNYKYYVGPHLNDSLNWQYTVSFAEQGKYKHVMSYYDGMLKNRQSITRFNSMPSKLIATEQVYDFEGRPTISILPTPITSSNFRYQPGLALNYNTGLPYRPQDFDTATAQPSVCPTDVLLPRLKATSLADIYYSPNNPDQAGFQKYVPDAGGYPFVQTLYSPGYDERVEKQGGAGDTLQIGHGHTVKNDYTATQQTDLNRLFGTNIGWTGFYRETASQDPNGQLSINITDYKGKTMMSSMVGLLDTVSHAIVTNENLADTSQYTEDFLAGMPQQVSGNQRILDKLFFNEAAGPSTAKYQATFTPFQTFCPTKYLSVKVGYKYSIINECGQYVIDTSQTHGTLGVTGVVTGTPVTYAGPTVPFFMQKGKHSLNKVLTVNTDDIALAVDSFISLPTKQNCMKDEPWFIKQSVLSKQFPCPENYIDLDCPSCGSDRYEMMKELFPNLDSNYIEKKYGIYRVINGVVVGNNNSDFTLYCGHGTDPAHWVDPYPDTRVTLALGTENTGFSINNWPVSTLATGNPLLTAGPYIVTSGDTLHCKYRYQDPCVVTMPASVIKYGHTYTHLQQIPVQDFINIFNDSIAAALLPMHPEYCKLLDCVDNDTFLKNIGKIPDAKIAEQLGMLRLDSLIHKDPIFAVMAAHPADFPNPYQSLAYLQNNFLCLDTIALNDAYCKSTDANMLSDCQSSIYHDKISSGVLINDYVKERYFQSIKNVYLANRKRFLYVLKPSYSGPVNCSICQPVRMKLVPPPVFPNDDSIGISLVDSFVSSLSANSNPSPAPGAAGTSATSALQQYYQAVNGVNLDTTETVTIAVNPADFGVDSLTLTIGPLQNIADSAVNGYIANSNLMMLAAVDSMMAQFANCTPFGNLNTAVKPYLLNLYATGQVTNFTFTPQQVLAALKAGGISLDDLCNPYIVNYDGLAPPSSDNTSGMDCGSIAYFNDVTSFLNSTSSLAALQHIGMPYGSVPLTGGNQFAQSLAGQLSNSSTCTVTAGYNSAQHLYTLAYNAGASVVTVTIKAAASGAGQYPFTAASGETVSLKADCYKEVFGNFPSGYIGDLSLALTAIHTPSSGAVTAYKMKAWNDHIGFNDLRNNPISQCVPYTQFRGLYKQFQDTMATYSINGLDHPYFSTMLKNFMNYSIHKVFTEDQYMAFMKSSAMGDSTFLPLQLGYVYLVANDSVYNSQFLAAMNAVDPLVNIIPSYRLYISGNGEELYVDFRTVPKNKLRVFKNSATTYISNHAADFGYTQINPTSLGATIIGMLAVPVNSTFDPTALPFFSGGFDVYSYNFDSYNWNGNGYDPVEMYYVFNYNQSPNYNKAYNNWQLEKYLNDNGLAYQYYSFVAPSVNEEYNTPEKQSYLHYAYGFQNLPSNRVLDTLQTGYLTSLIPVFNGKNLSYGHPARPDNIQNLYIGDPATATTGTKYDKLQYIVGKAGSYFNGLNGNSTNNILFAGANTRNITVPSGETLTAYRCRDTAIWYRYFGQGDTLYNVFLRIPAYIDTTYYAGYQLTGYGYNLGEGTSRSFWMSFKNPNAPITDMTINGFTDFTVAKNKVLHDVLLTHTIDEGLPDIDTIYNCEHNLLNTAIYQGKLQYKFYVDSIRSRLYGDFYAYIMNSGINEKLFISYRNQRFNYTLYNYDRAGNLIATVPPAGVMPLSVAYAQTYVDNYRTSGGNLPATHNKISNYQYNSLNQVVDQATPDGGETKFFYDAAGRVIFSQNDKQKPTGNMTYTLYDKQGRIVETGQAPVACPYFEPNTVSPAGDTCYSYDPAAGMFTPYPSVVFNLKTITHQAVIDYVRSKSRNEVVYTNYDAPVINLGAIPGLSDQENLRKRVATIKYFDFLQPTDTAAANYTYAMHFSYDIEGNVKTLTRDYPLWKPSNQEFKRVDYDYDVISGKVNLLSYNRSFADQFYQRYSYDADNRITKVETSSDGYIWDRDAEYQYYQHGPLARMSLGDLRVQGVDYAYTIQGWLKAINGDLLNTAKDMGGDGDNSTSSIHANDGVALSLDYFKGDYHPIGGTPVTNLSMPAKSLYNGNIPRATTAIAPFPDLASTYTYDQLNRIVKANYAAMHRVDTALTTTPNYYSSYAYDPDGNLKKLVRNGNKANAAVKMDSLVYKYMAPPYGSQYSPDNRLQNVNDYQANNNYQNDLKQNTSYWLNRYEYDATGNVIKDLVSGQDTIQWNHYNKVTLAASDTAGGNMMFGYDGAGNRYIKSVETDNGDTTWLKSEYNVRDAQGNILAIYNDDSKYKMGQETWIEYITQQITQQPCSHHFYIYNILVPFYAQNGYFKSAVLQEAQSNTTWAASQLSQYPPSYFMIQNKSIMMNMLYGSVDYTSFYGKLAGYSDSTGQTILANALDSASKNGMTGPLLQALVYRDPNVDPQSSIFYTMAAYSAGLADSILNIFGTGPSGDPVTDANTLSNFAGSDPLRFMSVLTTLGGKSKFATPYSSFLQAIFSPNTTLADNNNDGNYKPVFAFLCEYAPDLIQDAMGKTGLTPPNDGAKRSGNCDDNTAFLLSATQNSPATLLNFVSMMDQLGQENYSDEYTNFLSNIFQNSGQVNVDNMQKRAISIINHAMPDLSAEMVNQWRLFVNGPTEGGATTVGSGADDNASAQIDSNTNAIMAYIQANPDAQWDYINNAIDLCSDGDNIANYKNLLDSITLDSTLMQYQYYACNDCIANGTSGGALSQYFQDALANYTTDSDKIALAHFYDTWKPAKWLLRKTADNATLLGITYDADAGAFLDNYVTAAGNDYQLLNNGLNAIPHFSTTDFLHNLTCCVMAISPCTHTVIDSIVHTAIVNGLLYQNLSLASHVVYGSSRLGTKDYLPSQVYDKWDNQGPSLVVDTTQLNGRRPWYSLEYNDDINGLSPAPWPNNTDVSRFTVQRQIGQKQYELNNHLGNVQATISDLPYWATDGGDYSYITRKSPAMASAYDYYPFGMLMPDRYVSDTSSHCVTVTQTKWVKRDTTICHDVYDWVWPNIHIFSLATAVSDGKTLTFTAPTLSDGIAMDIATVPNLQQTLNMKLNSVDRTTGASMLLVEQQQVDGSWLQLASTRITPSIKVGFTAVGTAPVRWRLAGPYQIKVGTVCVTQTVLQQQSVLVDICNGDKDKYRFGFNGQEKVNEWSGIGNFLAFSERGQDTRIGRFLSVDPIANKYPWNSPFAFAENDVIRSIDLEGLEKCVTTFIFSRNKNVITLSNSDLACEANKPREEVFKFKLDNRMYTANSYTTLQGRDDGNDRLGDFSGVTTLNRHDIAKVLGYGAHIIFDWYHGNVEGAMINESNGSKYLPGKEVDFKNKAYELLNIDRNSLLEIDGTTYNANEAGNYLWGMLFEYYGSLASPNYVAERGSFSRGKGAWGKVKSFFGFEDHDEPHEQKAITAGRKAAHNTSKYEIKGGQNLDDEIHEYRLEYQQADKGSR